MCRTTFVANMGYDRFLQYQSLRQARCAVVFADLVESVRWYQTNEPGVIARWRMFAQQARDQWVLAHDGRVVRTDGDGLLMEFPDARRAVAGAFALHAGLAQHNLTHSLGKPLLLRVGLHVDNVSFDDREAYGAGVNLAQRITTLAQPGQTLVSAAARDGLVDGVHAHLEDLGDRYAKEMDVPVRVVRVSPVGGLIAKGQTTPPHSISALRPTLAVVPFQAASADVEHQALGHAMADDIIAALSRHPGLQMVSRLSTAPFREKSLDWSQLRPLLGATFVLSGRYYISGSRVRLTLELCEVEQGHVLWADSARADVQALFEGTDELVPLVVRQVASHISARELVRVRSLPMDTLQSYTLYLGAEGLMCSLVRQDFIRCREVLEHLTERHPRQAVPHAMLAKWHVNNLVQVWSDDELGDQRKGMEHAARALDLDPEQPLALAAAGLVQMNLKGDMTGARKLLEKALQIDQQQATAWAWLSAIQAYGREHSAAQVSAAKALALSPLDPERHVFEAYAAMADMAAGQFHGAVAHARQSLRLHALHSPSHRLLVGGLWLAGQQGHARQAAQQWLEAFPGAHSGTRTARGLGETATWRDHFADAVRSAGVPSASTLPRAPTQLS